MTTKTDRWQNHSPPTAGLKVVCPPFESLTPKALMILVERWPRTDINAYQMLESCPVRPLAKVTLGQIFPYLKNGKDLCSKKANEVRKDIHVKWFHGSPMTVPLLQFTMHGF